MSKSGIHIKPSKKGTFTAAAKKHGKGVQEFARQVMANKENYSPAMVKKANFARNAAKWKHESGGGVDAGYQELGGVHSMRPLPGHQVPVGNAFTATPGHQYPFYERDMQPLPRKAMYGADIEPFVYHGYSENTPIGDGIRSNWHEPKEMLSAKAGIHINPANKGKFTATKKRTGKSTEELTHSKNPLTRKRAIFAQNARKWAKKDAGDLLPTNEPKQKGTQADNLYMTPELARQATAAYTPAQNAVANPILTAANTGAPLGIQPLNTLTHETGRNTDMGLTSTSGLKRSNQAAVNKKQKPVKNSQTEEKEAKDRSWIAPAAMTAAAFINSNIKRGPGRQYYTQYDEPYYNPYPTGTGSQAIYDQGGFVNSNAVDFPYKSGIRFAHGGEIMNVASPESPIARMGGNIRRNYMSEYEEGGELQLYDDRTGAQPISENPYAGSMVEFKGPSHEERNDIGSNGIPMSWQGNDVEVEGGETGFKDQAGNFQILGNMKNPITGRKFKNDGKILAKEEQKANKRLQKGLDLVNEADPDNPFEMLKFNSGKAKMQGAEQKLRNLTAVREQMAEMQQAKLDMAAALGIEPMEMDKAYFGKMMTAQGGIGMPFEMDVKGVPIEDYAVQGLRSQKASQNNPQFFQPTNNFSNPAWDTYPTNPTASAIAPVIAATQKKAATTSTIGGRGGETRRVVPPTEPQEDKTFKPSMPRPVPYDVNTGNIDVATATGANNTGRKFEFAEPADKSLVSDAEGFNNWNIVPEIFSVLTNQYDPVLMQKYRPELMQPYQMSFQDQLNRNTDTFRAAAKASDWNPSAIGALAAQKYAADQGVLGSEFRTNQEIAANVANANRQIMNETQKMNLGLADQQYVRQAQAKANTRQRDFDAIQSAVQKQLQHTAAMNKLRTLENMYDYRFDPRYKAMYEGPDAYYRNPVVQNMTPEELRAAAVEKELKSSKKTTKRFGGSIAKQFKYYKP